MRSTHDRRCETGGSGDAPFVVRLARRRRAGLPVQLAAVDVPISCATPARHVLAVRHDRSVAEAVVRALRECPWGLVVLGDPADKEPLPTEFGDADVVATR